MRTIRKAALLALALALLLCAAWAEDWHPAEDDLPRYRQLFDLLTAALDEPAAADRAAADAPLEQIRQESEDDYDVGKAVTDHWFATVLNSRYHMYYHRGEKTAPTLKYSGADFSARHAFVVLGYQLQNGEMQPELIGRCEAAAAAARSFPEAILVCTGGVTGHNNPGNHSEAGEMKKYLAGQCGIDAERIFTDEAAMTTTENAINTFRILKEQGIESITVVTSDYHQLWGQVLFNAMAAVYEKSAGYKVRIAGNFNYPARPDSDHRAYCRSALNQLPSLFMKDLGIPR